MTTQANGWFAETFKPQLLLPKNGTPTKEEISLQEIRNILADKS